MKTIALLLLAVLLHSTEYVCQNIESGSYYTVDVEDNIKATAYSSSLYYDKNASIANSKPTYNRTIFFFIEAQIQVIDKNTAISRVTVDSEPFADYYCKANGSN